MFAKLLKHEWRANRLLLAILTLSLAGVGVVATVALRLLVNYGDLLFDSENISLSMTGLGLVSVVLVCAIGLAIYSVGVRIWLLIRFYKHKFTDEGYLTFTLPVKTWQIFWSSLLHMYIWMVISDIAVGIVLAAVLLIGTSTQGLVNQDAIDFLKLLWDWLVGIDWSDFAEIFGSDMLWTAILALLQALVSPFYTLIVPMACITIGAVIVKKFKLLTAIGLYLGVQAVSGILESMASMLPTMLLVTGGTTDLTDMMNLSSLIQLLITVGLTVTGYILSMRLMSKKLNLP